MDVIFREYDVPFELEIRIRLNMREGGWGRSLYVGEFCVKWVNFISHGRGGGLCQGGNLCQRVNY